MSGKEIRYWLAETDLLRTQTVNQFQYIVLRRPPWSVLSICVVLNLHIKTYYRFSCCVKEFSFMRTNKNFLRKDHNIFLVALRLT